ncbi:MAG TPA: GGDEF domain-containing protein [Patescibacteria group bacterium]|nr:GGDEF domain-containing protein [Patescibacteria group bacterium]
MERKHDRETYIYNEVFRDLEIQHLQKIIAGQQDENALLREENRQLRHDLIHDRLTGLKSRGYFDEYIENLCQTISNRPNQGIHTASILYIDIDHFKLVNDTLGHDAGDAVLRKVASLLDGHVRDLDIVARLEEEGHINGRNIAARLGGEEMIIILLNTHEEVAAKRAEQLRKIVETHGQCTISIGVAEYQQGLLPHQFIKRADQAVYGAKHTGRNKVCRYSQLPTQAKPQPA